MSVRFRIPGFSILFLIVVFMGMSINARNLRIVRSVSLGNYELMDVETGNGMMIISGGIGGSILYDISDPLRPADNPNGLTTMRFTNCEFGRTYKWALGRNIAIGTARECGFGIWDISDPENISLQAHVNIPAGKKASYEDAAIYGNYAVLTAHTGGVHIFDISRPYSPELISRVSGGNAWAIDVHDGLAYVADANEGLRIIDITDISSPEQISVMETSGTVKDVKYREGIVFLAAGNSGVDMMDVENPESPRMLDNVSTTGLASRIAVSGDLIGVSAWDNFEVLRREDGTLRRVGYKNTGGRVMAAGTPGGNYFYSAEWSQLRIYEYSTIEAADLDVSPMHAQFPHLNDGQSDTQRVSLTNNGGGPLEITSLGTTHDDFTIFPSIQTISPGESKSLNIVYTPISNSAHGNLTIVSNDPDEGIKTIELLGNDPHQIDVGKSAPNFTLPVAANGIGEVQLSELKGQIIVLAFFASW